jgi:hypothetical protein
MNSKPNYFRQWAAQCSQAVGGLYDIAINSLLESPRLQPKLAFVLSRLVLSSQLTSESALLLIEQSRLWDTEILIRPVAEGTVRLVYVSSSHDPKECLKRADEYLTVIPEMQMIGDHKRFEAFLAIVDDPSANEWRPFRELLLSDLELKALETKYPRKYRQQLDHKWSFNEMVRSLVESGIPGLESLVAMSREYSRASHLVHQDGTAISMISERNSRNENNRAALELAHCAREVGDLLTFATLRAIYVLKLTGGNKQPVFDITAAYAPLNHELKQAYSSWYDKEYEHEEDFD